MREFMAITKAISDETRVRALVSLRDGELCVCQIIDMLELAPSTVSRHMSILHDAGLIERRKEGRWHYYRLAGREAMPIVRQALKWVMQSIADAPPVARDRQRLLAIRGKELQVVCECYRA